MPTVISAGRPAIVVARPVGPVGPAGPPGPAGGSAGTFIQAGTGAVTRDMQDKVREHVSITDFGAIGDNATDNLAAITLALNSGSRHVIIPNGQFRSSPGIVIPDYVCVEGFGRETSYLTCTSATADFITMGTSSTLRGVHINHSVTRTNGVTVKMTGNGGELSDFHMAGWFNGIVLQGTSYPGAPITGPRIYAGAMLAPSVAAGGAAISIQNYASPFLDNLMITGVIGGPQPTIGIVVGAGDTVVMTAVHVLGFKAGLYVNPPADNTSFGGLLTGCTFDSCEDAAKGCIQFTPANANSHIKLWAFDNCWTGTSAGIGLWMEAFGAGASIDGIQWTNGRVINLGVDGVLVGNGAKNIFINGNQIGECDANGVRVNGNASHVQIVNNICGNLGDVGDNLIGINLGGSCDYITVSENDLFGNGTAFSYSSSGTHNIVRDNPGHNPVGVATVTVGPSPFIVTNGPSPATVYVSGGTGVTLTQAGATLGNISSFGTVELGPNELLGIFYATAPTVNVFTH